MRGSSRLASAVALMGLIGAVDASDRAGREDVNRDEFGVSRVEQKTNRRTANYFPSRYPAFCGAKQRTTARGEHRQGIKRHKRSH